MPEGNNTSLTSKSRIMKGERSMKLKLMCYLGSADIARCQAWIITAHLLFSYTWTLAYHLHESWGEDSHKMHEFQYVQFYRSTKWSFFYKVTGRISSNQRPEHLPTPGFVLFYFFHWTLADLLTRAIDSEYFQLYFDLFLSEGLEESHSKGHETNGIFTGKRAFNRGNNVPDEK